MKKRIKRLICKFFNNYQINTNRRLFNRQIRSRIDNIKEIETDKRKEEEYVKKWRIIDKKVSPLYYRVYKTLSGNDSLDYIPDYLYYTYIEPLLNNYKMLQLGEEKNYYDKLFDDLGFPETIIRNINGIFYDLNYKKIDLDDTMLNNICSKFESVFIKPTINTGQGKNTIKFYKERGEFFESNGIKLTKDYLKDKYRMNFIIQESLKQSALLNTFNSTSINCLRILTYRSVKNNNVYVLRSTLKVGNKGSIIDAARAGGRFCGIEDDGTLCKITQDAKGNKYEDFNGIKISNNNYKIPNYDNVLNLAKLVAEQVHHHRVLALDIMIDDKNKPRVIEVNPSGQGIFIYQATIGPMFGNFTEEIINYCIGNAKHYFEKCSIEI